MVDGGETPNPQPPQRVNPFARKIILVHHVDGTVTKTPCRASAEMALEAKYHVGLRDAFGGEDSSTRLYYLAYECERRSGGLRGESFPEFELWADTVDAIDIVVESVPFSEAQSDTPSPS
jgi:hypothetical protein